MPSGVERKSCKAGPAQKGKAARNSAQDCRCETPHVVCRSSIATYRPHTMTLGTHLQPALCEDFRAMARQTLARWQLLRCLHSCGRSDAHTAEPAEHSGDRETAWLYWKTCSYSVSGILVRTLYTACTTQPNAEPPILRHTAVDLAYEETHKMLSATNVS